VLSHNNGRYKVFGVKDATTESLVDQIRNQWHFFQNEDIKKEWYQEEEDDSSSSRRKDSYWAGAEQLCGIESIQFKRNMKRMDDFWEKVNSLRDERVSKISTTGCTNELCSILKPWK